MLKRKLEDSSEKRKPCSDASLPHHPLNFLIPTQNLIPLALPFEATIPAETILFSQDDVNNNESASDIVKTFLCDSEDPDLKYVRFKKPLIKELKNSPVTETAPSNGIKDYELLQNVKSITKKEFVKVHINASKLTVNNLDDESQLLNQTVNLFDNDGENESSSQLSKMETENDSCDTSTKPDFCYDTKVSQTVLMSHLNDELARSLCFINSLLNEKFDYNDEDDITVDYKFTKFNSFPLVRPELLGFVRSKLMVQLKSDSHNSISFELLVSLVSYCFNIVRDLLSVEWETVFNDEESPAFFEYQQLHETIILAASILLILNINQRNQKIVPGDQGILVVIDFFVSFAGFSKCVFTKAEFNELPDFVIPVIRQFQILAGTLNECLPELTLDDSLITRLEYISYDILFSDTIQSKERSNLNVFLEELRLCFSHTLIAIYSKYEDQRQFLLNEIIENLNLLSPLKSKAKNLQLKSGGTIQIITYTVLKMIESHNKFSQNFEFSQWLFLSRNATKKSEVNQLKEFDDRFWSSIKSEASSMKNAVDYFSSNLIKRIVHSYSPSLKKVIENLINDLVTMVALPEFPAAPYLINGVLDMCLQMCNSSEITSAHAFLFEITGTFGATILNFKQLYHSPCFNENISVSELDELMNKKYLPILTYMKLDRNFKSQFDFLQLQLFDKLSRISKVTEMELKSEKDVIVGEKLVQTKKLLKQAENGILALKEFFVGRDTKDDWDTLTDSMFYDLYLDCLSSHELMTRYSEILNFILLSLKISKVKSRANAIKNLTLLIDKEIMLVEDIALRDMIKIRLNESSATVIDAVLDLLEKIIDSKSQYIPEFSDLICAKIYEPSINVKRKTANLVSKMFSNTNEMAIKVKLIQALLSQIDDEDDRIIDLVCTKMIQMLFFNDKFITMENAENSSYVPSVNILLGLYQQGYSTWDLFERFFEEKVANMEDLDDLGGRNLKSSLQGLVDSLLALITDLVGCNDDEDSQRLNKEAALGVLATLVKYDQSLITQHQIVSLQPYIINDFDKSDICYHSLQIMNIALDHHKTLNKTFANVCKQSLLKRLTKFNSKELEQSIQCIWKLFSIENNTSSVSKACISSLKLILKYISQLQVSVKDFKPDAAIPRLLYLVGNFGRYCNFENDRMLFMEANLGLKEKESIFVFLLKFILKFCDSSILKSLRKIAIKNALNICISHPKLFFSVPITKLIDSTFKKKDAEISGIIIGAFLVLLENEEAHMLKKNGFDVKRSSSLKLDVAIFHGYSLEYVNDGICSTIVQRYLNSILDACLDSNIDYTLNAVKFLNLVVKFGFSNPKICFPTVVALECAKSPYVRHLALEMHAFLFKKFETLIESTYSEALKIAMKYVSKVYKLDELDKCKVFLNSFAKIVYARNSKQRVEKLLQAIFRALNNISMYKFQRLSKNDLLSVQNQMIFLFISLNEMEFKRQLDLLQLINYLEKVILREENIFGDQFTILIDLFEDNEDETEKLKYLVMSKMLLAMKCLVRILMSNYQITPEIMLKFQESKEHREFLFPVKNTNYCTFFTGEVKTLLIDSEENHLTLLHKKLSQLSTAEYK
ncbi:hypothetical protein CANINC_000393 [Pichia inconspicua]|uniref:Sister chromatid cohesion protein n=1 Tax=Pichia inconspicua TaxID=52247 RepID=A0A4T0X7S0_9ASCO|nr:hypothetical protein CANINC_000393 [[Candida] inconspicua]